MDLLGTQKLKGPHEDPLGSSGTLNKCFYDDNLFVQAPTPGQEWTSPTASEWELSRDALNISILPLDLLCEDISVTEKSCWETSSLESLAKSCLDFTFTTGLQHVLTVEPQLTKPCDIAYIPKRCS